METDAAACSHKHVRHVAYQSGGLVSFGVCNLGLVLDGPSQLHPNGTGGDAGRPPLPGSLETTSIPDAPLELKTSEDSPRLQGEG